MILIRKRSIPPSLVRYKRTINASFDSLPKGVKDKIRISLLEEQGYICAYCMRKLRDDSSQVKIEHYIARTEDNELDYKNLLAVCKGNEGESLENQTCDTRKGNREIKINPQKSRDILTVSYTNDGKIKSTNEYYQKDFDDRLNLNGSLGLMALRKSALDSLKRKLYERRTHLTRETIEKIYNKYLEVSVKESYVGIFLWYLQKKLK